MSGKIGSTNPSDSMEPSVHLPRPSSGQTQDVRHILANTFKHLFARDVLPPQTIENLLISQGKEGSDVIHDEYHQTYVSALQEVYAERQGRLAEAAMLERHIMQAQARATSAEERQLNRMNATCDNYDDLGLPAGDAHFESCIDRALLKKHNLLVPEDYFIESAEPPAPPQLSDMPSYAQVTETSKLHSREKDNSSDNVDLIVLSDDVKESKITDAERKIIDVSKMDKQGMRLSLNKECLPNDAWREHMNEEIRERDRTDLSNLEAKVKYLRNPRHAPLGSAKGERSLVKDGKQVQKTGTVRKIDKPITEETAVIFLASPPIVRFADYKIGAVYETTLELKNLTSVLRSCRILPPATEYFSVGLGQFPGEHGLVAPGMSCHYTIRFAPDSLADYDDMLTIQTQSSGRMLIPLQGRREPPYLTLPSCLDVGHCLIGAQHIVHFVLTNSGGPGRFCLVPSAAWPASNFKSTIRNGSVSIYPFDIRPSVFELMSKQTGMIEVVFTPPAVGEYTQEIVIVCDNCQVKKLLIKGQAEVAKVEVLSSASVFSLLLPGEVSDSSAEHLVRFNHLNPFTFTDKSIMVKNLTHVDLKFHWMIYKPDLQAPHLPVSVDDDDGDDNDDNVKTLESSKPLLSERVAEIDSVFSIQPPVGVLNGNDTLEFKLTFAPPTVGLFHNALHMILSAVPATPNPSDASLPSVFNGRPRHSSQSLRSLTSSHSLRRESSSFNPDTIEDTGVNALTSELSMTRSNVPLYKALTVLQLEAKAQSIPLSVVLHPYAIFIPGKLLVGNSIKKVVTMVNQSLSTINFQWEGYNDEHILEVEPPYGELDAGMAVDLELNITGSVPGPLKQTMYCYVENLAEPLHLRVEADIKGPEINIDQPDIQFGLVRLGQIARREIIISNMCQMPSKWVIMDRSKEIEDTSAFVFKPSSGELAPLECRKIAVVFRPSSMEPHDTVFEIAVQDGGVHHLSVHAVVQSPAVCLLKCEISADSVYYDVPFVYKAVLYNQTVLSAEFEWGQALGVDAADVCVNVKPRKGVINAHEKLEIDVTLTAKKYGPICDLRLACFVKDTSGPLYLSLLCDVKGLSVTCYTTTDGHSCSSSNLSLDFGDSASLGIAGKRFLHIRNESAIPSSYSVSVEKYVSKPPTPPSGDSKPFSGRSGQRRLMQGQSLNLTTTPISTDAKASADVCKAMLQSSNGLSFYCRPASSELPPFKEVLVEVTAFADMWGIYTDVLVLKVNNRPPVNVPMSITVQGSPLTFQLTTSQPHQRPVLRMGTHVAGAKSVSRAVRLNNEAPIDVRVDWQVYNVGEESDKLIDFIMWYGDPFPLQGQDGQELLSLSQDLDQTEPRPLTGMIPYSADSTPLLSRQFIDTPTSCSEDSNQEQEPDKPISVFLRVHEGTESYTPYDIYPRQLIIPARGSAVVNVRFTAPPSDEFGQERDYQAYIHGYISMDRKVADVQRIEGYDLQPLRLDMTSHVKPALLNIEYSDDEGMRYRAAMSDIIQDKSLGSFMKESVMQLLNMTQTPLTFTLSTVWPFLIQQDTDKPATLKSAVNVLDPRCTQTAKVFFCPSTDLLRYANELEAGDEWDGIMYEKPGGEQKLQIRKQLLVEFNNGAQQIVNLHATLSLPSLQLSTDLLNFGTCLIGQKRSLQFTVSNKTLSGSHWTVIKDLQSDTCTDATFDLSLTSGYLEPYVSFQSKNKCLITVDFTAKHTEYYQVTLLFQGHMGEETKSLKVIGIGSYDGKHEAVLSG